ncbi:MAG TPA: phosphatidylglycerol lysyltransferase domain-containing protein [Coleofasciculaceae cyanobacterium]
MANPSLPKLPPRLTANLSRPTRIGLWSAALLTGLMGVVNLLSAVTPSLPARRAWLEEFLPFYMRSGSRIFAALAGFVLLLLSVNLLRRKWVAWILTVALLILSIISHLIKGLDFEECFLATILLVQLWLMRNVFTAKSDRPSIAQGLWVLGVAILFTLAYGTAGFYILDGHFQINGQLQKFGLGAALVQTLAMFFTEDNAGLQPIGRFAGFFADSIYTIGVSTLLFACFMLLRPVLLRGDPATQRDRQQARTIIDEYGHSSLARLALLSDKSYFFSPSRQSVIAYVSKGRAAIALGDPIGPANDRREVVIAFSEFCNRNDWFPVFYEAEPSGLPLYGTLGMQWVQIGEEAIVDLKTFNLKGKSNQSLRTACNRLTKTGHTFQVFKPPIHDQLLDQLEPVSNDWLHAKQGSEKRFSMGWFDRTYLRDSYIAVVYDAGGRITAFADLLWGYDRKEVTVDLMRHRADAEKGTMEFLFVSMFQYFQKLEYESFSLSLSPLAGVGSTPDARKVEKGLNYFFENLNRFYSFKGLHQFKEKFQARWEPRYLVFTNLSTLPDIAVGLVRADSGDRLLDYFKFWRS